MREKARRRRERAEVSRIVCFMFFVIEYNVAIHNWRVLTHTRRTNLQSDVDNKRKRATQKYNDDMKYIDGVAGGARAKAEEGRRNSLLKNKEKANYIRRTGKTPSACPCF